MVTRDNIEAFLRQTPRRFYCDTCIRDILRVPTIDDVRNALEIINRQSGFMGQQTLCAGCGQYKFTISAR